MSASDLSKTVPRLITSSTHSDCCYRTAGASGERGGDQPARGDRAVGRAAGRAAGRGGGAGAAAAALLGQEQLSPEKHRHRSCTQRDEGAKVTFELHA